MVASYPCNEGGMLDMCVIGATSHEVGQALHSHIIVAMSVSLRNEIEVTNGVSTKIIVEKKGWGLRHSHKNVSTATKILPPKKTTFDIEITL